MVGWKGQNSLLITKIVVLPLYIDTGDPSTSRSLRSKGKEKAKYEDLQGMSNWYLRIIDVHFGTTNITFQRALDTDVDEALLHLLQSSSAQHRANMPLRIHDASLQSNSKHNQS